MEPTVYHVPDKLPLGIALRLEQHFGIRPGDDIVMFSDESPPLMLQRDYDGEDADELQGIMESLISEQGFGPQRHGLFVPARRAAGSRLPQLLK